MISLAREKLTLITRNVAEVLTKEDLAKQLESGRRLKGYIGVEPSGLFHIGWTIWARKIQDLMDAGVDFILLEATWHAWINDKLGGSLENIHLCADYIEHCLRALGVDVDRLRIIRAEEMVRDPEYWSTVLKVAKELSLARVKRALTIMGRKQREALLDFSKLIYPCMQVADIFYLGLDICLGGTDQRKAHVMAREIASAFGREKPVAIHTPLLVGLEGMQRMDTSLFDAKMSKSKPEKCIFIHDSEEDIRKKVLDAYCPPKEVKNNPVLEINRLLLFSDPGFTLYIDRPSQYGGPLEVSSFRELSKMYRKGELHPLDLKNAAAKALSDKLAPVREYFESNKEARELLQKISKLMITR